ncbi:hypothetical protein BN1708_020120 [Verticillium longisporum]|uniref:Uncharacterized protein n=1 Tax=Verticillium longisporum TaxID=100787 RepID=A0A0G4MRM4_VERLO|nr:hypothetical protein BN1708_020120 [Verticillium longisporum]
MCLSSSSSARPLSPPSSLSSRSSAILSSARGLRSSTATPA